MVLVNEPIEVPSVDFESLIVGLTLILQQTPLSVISAPPSEVTFPPPVAVELVVPLTVAVVTVGFDAITMSKVLGVLVPHELFAVTDIVPPLAPAVVVIDVLVEDPLHPDGNVQVYDVAPVIADIL